MDNGGKAGIGVVIAVLFLSIKMCNGCERMEETRNAPRPVQSSMDWHVYEGLKREWYQKKKVLEQGWAWRDELPGTTWEDMKAKLGQGKRVRVELTDEHRGALSARLDRINAEIEQIGKQMKAEGYAVEVKDVSEGEAFMDEMKYGSDRRWP